MNIFKEWIAYENSDKKASFSHLYLLWKTSHACRKTIREDSELKNLVNQKRKTLGLPEHLRTSSAGFKKDLSTLVHSACLIQAEKISQKIDAKKIKAQVITWLKDPAFLKLSQTCFVIDESIDRLLGLNERKVKALVTSQMARVTYRKEDLYLESPPEELYTPYWVTLSTFKKLKPQPNSVWIDLGSGLGRVGIVLGLFYPKVNFIGYEIMKERSSQAEAAAVRLQLSKRIRFYRQDLSLASFSLPMADYYFLFNPFNLRTLRFLLNKIRKNSESSEKPLNLLSVKIGRPQRVLPQQTFLKKKGSVLTAPTWEGRGVELFITRNHG